MQECVGDRDGSDMCVPTTEAGIENQGLNYALLYCPVGQHYL